jgi:hypothetical protein
VTAVARQPNINWRAAEYQRLRPLNSEDSMPTAHGTVPLASALAAVAQGPCIQEMVLREKLPRRKTRQTKSQSRPAGYRLIPIFFPSVAAMAARFSSVKMDPHKCLCCGDCREADNAPPVREWKRTHPGYWRDTARYGGVPYKTRFDCKGLC